MKVTVLASGSKGNGTLIENNGHKIMIDAGIAYKHFAKAFDKFGSPEALFISHSHGDHVKSAGTVSRELNIPVYLHSATYEKTQDKIFKNCKVYHIDPGIKDPVILFNNTLKITPFSTQHDCEACVGFVIEDLITNKKLCYLTDTGSFTKVMYNAILDCHAYIIETDYDEKMLEDSDYDQLLKDRIVSDFGHLSNQQVVELLNKLDMDKIKFVALVHLSENTNSPETVEKIFKENFPKHFDKILIEPINKTIVL